MDDIHFMKGYETYRQLEAGPGDSEKLQGCTGLFVVVKFNCTQIHLCFIWANIVFLNRVLGPHYNIQTDYIMPRPQGNPSGLLCFPGPGYQLGVS